MTRARIWVVDDDDDHRIGLCDLMATTGYDAQGFDGARAALDQMDVDTPDLILSDLRMPGVDGIAFLEAVRGRAVDLPLILLTGHGDVGQAVKAIHLGAQDFLEKPYDADHLLSVVNRTLQAVHLRKENAALRASLDALKPRLLGETTAIDNIRKRIEKIAPLDVDVILMGETGTGKDLTARILHQRGPRAAGPFVTINCAALREDNFDADLFGHLRSDGTYRSGRIVQADGGTLFLDQIEALPLSLQSRLLGVIQSCAVELDGDTRPVDLRILAASAADLKDLIAQDRFRLDLFFRLAAVELTLPPLREISADIPLLFTHFVAEAAARYGLPEPEITFADRKALLRHHWPGNAHELRQLAQRRVIGLDTRAGGTGAAPVGTLKERVRQFETMEIARVLDRCKGNTARAAQELGIPRRTLNAKISASHLRGRGDAD